MTEAFQERDRTFSGKQDPAWQTQTVSALSLPLFLSILIFSFVYLNFSQVLASADVAVAMLQAGVPTAVLDIVGHQVGEAVAAVLRQCLGDAMQNKVTRQRHSASALLSPLLSRGCCDSYSRCG